MPAYATPFDLMERKDHRTIGDLAGDDTRRVTEAEIPTDPNVLQALEDASGMVESAMLVGGKYTVEDLESLTGNSLAYLQRIVCEIAICLMITRRPDMDVERLNYYQKLIEVLLKPFRDGDAIFDIPGVVDSSLASVDGPSTLEMEALNLTRDLTQNYYPGRIMPFNR